MFKTRLRRLLFVLGIGVFLILFIYLAHILNEPKYLPTAVAIGICYMIGASLIALFLRAIVMFIVDDDFLC